MGRVLTHIAAIAVAAMIGGMPVRVSGTEAFASEPPFDQTAFDTAQKDGRPIVVHVTADWCSVCMRQKPILEELLREPRFKPYTVFNVDFDSQKDLVRKLGARAQSTFIVFKGKTQQAISSGDTRPKAIEVMLAKGLRDPA